MKTMTQDPTSTIYFMEQYPAIQAVLAEAGFYNNNDISVLRTTYIQLSRADEALLYHRPLKECYHNSNEKPEEVALQLELFALVTKEHKVLQYLGYRSRNDSNCDRPVADLVALDTGSMDHHLSGAPSTTGNTGSYIVKVTLYRWHALDQLQRKHTNIYLSNEPLTQIEAQVTVYLEPDSSNFFVLLKYFNLLKNVRLVSDDLKWLHGDPCYQFIARELEYQTLILQERLWIASGLCDFIMDNHLSGRSGYLDLGIGKTEVRILRGKINDTTNGALIRLSFSSNEYIVLEVSETSRYTLRLREINARFPTVDRILEDVTAGLNSLHAPMSTELATRFKQDASIVKAQSVS